MDTTDSSVKLCTKCSTEKSLDQFSRDTRRKDGLNLYCKLCIKEYRQQRVAKIDQNRDSIPVLEKKCLRCSVTKSFKFFSKRKDQADGYNYWCKECASAAYYENREHNIKVSQLWKINNWERHQEYRRDYYNRPEVKQRAKAYRETHREWYLAWLKDWYERNKETLLPKYRAYHYNNREVYRKASQKRRALLLGSIVEGEPLPTVEALRTRDGSLCHYCDVELDFSPRVRGNSPSKNAVELEHKVPLSFGGKHTLSNTVLACRACNQEKHTKNYEDFKELKQKEENNGTS